jgi:hypothetical protein
LAGHGLGFHTFENDAAGKLRGIVAIGAVAFEHAPVLLAVAGEKHRAHSDGPHNNEGARGGYGAD